MRVLHLLNRSLPYISGSTIRTKYIFKFQKKFSKIIALTSFLFEKSKKNLEIIENIPYYRINKSIAFLMRKYYNLINRLNHAFYKFFNIDIENNIQYFPISILIKYYIKKLIYFYNIDIIHQHTHYDVGQCSVKLAKKYKIPFIYEVRGFIEESILANSKIQKSYDPRLLSYRYSKIKGKETEIMRNSDLVITLSEPMKQELIKRNIDKNKIKIISNGVDTGLLKPVKVNVKLKEKLNLNEKFIIGFIGDMRWLEGLDILIKALPFILKETQNIGIVLIGNVEKEYLKYLKRLSNELKVSKYISFLGVIPHDEIKEYYSIIDIIVLHRLNFKLSRLVTPLKQLEAMAFKTIVIASDLPALRDTIKPKETGDLFKPENPKELASKILYYLSNPAEKRKIEDFARSYVDNNLSWKKIIPKYEIIYRELLKNK